MGGRQTCGEDSKFNSPAQNRGKKKSSQRSSQDSIGSTYPSMGNAENSRGYRGSTCEETRGAGRSLQVQPRTQFVKEKSSGRTGEGGGDVTAQKKQWIHDSRRSKKTVEREEAGRIRRGGISLKRGASALNGRSVSRRGTKEAAKRR